MPYAASRPEIRARRSAPHGAAPAAAPSATAPRVATLDDLPMHDARLLTGEAGAARIVLDGAVYTLRITRQGKLILTK